MLNAENPGLKTRRFRMIRLQQGAYCLKTRLLVWTVGDAEDVMG